MSSPAVPPAPRTRQSAPRLIALAVGLVFAVSGAWALVAPESFYESVALFPPYNQHFLQDIGAFQIGLSAVLLLASSRVPVDALAVALLGVGIGNAAHLVSHVIGLDLGGKPAIDIPLFAVVTAVLLWAGVARLRGGRLGHR